MPVDLNSDDEPDYFDTVREQLRYWPYTVHQIDDTLDVNLIEGRGKQLLFRAIHSNNLLAFAGSGLSMSYGRLSWREWQVEQKRVVSRSAKAFEKLTKASLRWNRLLEQLLDQNLKPENSTLSAEFFDLRDMIWDRKKNGDELLPQKHRHNLLQWLRSQYRSIEYAKRQIERLHQTFDLTQIKGGHFPGGEELPVKFEIAQQLHNQLRVFTDLFLPSHDPEPMPKGALTKKAFEKILAKAWAGSYQSQTKNAAPSEGLEALRQAIEYSGPDWRRAVISYQNGEPNRRSNDSVQLRMERKNYRNARKDYIAALEEFAHARSGPEASQTFEQLAKSLLIDECPHALFTLRQGLLKGRDIDDEGKDPKWIAAVKRMQDIEGRLDVLSGGNQKRDIEGIRQNPDRYKVLSPFKLHRVQKLVQDRERPDLFPDLWDGFWAVFAGHLGRYIEREKVNNSGRIYVTPSTRFVVALILMFYEDPFDEIDFNDNTDPVARKKGATKQAFDGFFERPAATDFTSRRSIIADRFDPLAKTERNMGITRYITTNYDFEIERYFQDQGYRHFPPNDSHDPEMRQSRPADDPDEFQADMIGRTLTDRCFTSSRAAELTSFALDASKSAAGVYHLHGRASRDDRLVITERDYMKLYLTQDERRATIDEGISVAFSGAPLLFLGLGMEETDLLRPLRQFISNRDRTVGYTSIALLPADKGMAARAKFASALYLRYGVHTVFYGSGTVEVEGELEPVGIDWLCRIISVIDGLRAELKLWTKEELKDEERGPKEIVTALYDIVDVLGPDLAADEEEAKKPALNVLFGLGDKARRDDLHTEILEAHKTACEKAAKGASGGLASAEIEGLHLKTCRFTTTRPKDMTKNMHRDESEASINGDTHLKFYTNLLDSVLKIVVSLPTAMDGKDHTQRKQIVAPIGVALDGLHGAIITACLNAALEGISREKDAWWTSWQEPPLERIALAHTPHEQLIKIEREDKTEHEDKAEKKEKTEDEDKDKHEDKAEYVAFYELPATFVRHRVDNAITGLQDAEADHPPGGVLPYADLLDTEIDDTEPARLCHENRTMIRAFDTFIAALKCSFEKSLLRPRNDRRLLVTVAARRGMGKGTFMSAFATKRGQRLYDSAAWTDRDSHTFISGRLFINLGFSPEVASSYDMILDATIKVIAALGEPGDAKKQAGLRDNIQAEISGLSRIAALRSIFLRYKEASEAHSKENNGKRPRLVISLFAIDLLFDKNKRPKNGEIDRILKLIFSDDLKYCPIDFIFVGDDTCLGAPWSEKNSERMRVRLERDNLREMAEEGIQRAMVTSGIEFDDPRPPQDYDMQPQTTKTEHHFIHFTRPVNAVSLLNSNFPVLASTMYFLNPPTTDEGDQLGPKIWDEISEAIRDGRQNSDKAMLKAWTNKSDPPHPDDLADIRRQVWEVYEERLGDKLRAHAKSNGIIVGEDADITLVLRHRLSSNHNTKDMHEWRDIRRNMGNSRFALTILLAAAEQIIIYAENAHSGAKQAEAFIRDTVAEVRGVGVERRDQMVLNAVIDAHRQFHRIGDPDLDCELHLLIIRHLGVIGTPVGSAAMVRLPEVREYFERLGVEPETSRRRFLVRALTVLAHRGLVFRLEPNSWLKLHDVKKDWPADLEYRYSLHRVVQNFALVGLNTGTSDPVRNNSFAPSLYAVMPPTGPRLSRETYRFLRTLLIGLSQYPDVSTTDTSAKPWLFTTKDRSVRIQALRAALTLARSIFSVAVVSRMSEQKPIGDGLQKRGYLETYRVRLRWIIRMAWESADPEQRRALKEHGTPYKQINALYLDEIVWLYNELGVISLAQGSLSDALGYLRQAAEQNERVEGRSRNTPIFNHIDLNHAVVQIERGSFNSARRRLDRVYKATRERAFNLHFTALGYRCVLNHLSGARDGLKRDFRRTVKHFEQSNESRAAALFLMHEGRFLAETDPETAQNNIARARDMAETDGHEDVRHHIELARIRAKTLWVPDRQFDANDHTVILRVENFAREMAIWSLQVDALRLRAQLLLEQGETATAGRLVARAMAIAKRHSLVLRLNSCMTCYADILLTRGDVKGAERMALASLSLAKRTGYNLETPRAQLVIRNCQ